MLLLWFVGLVLAGPVEDGAAAYEGGQLDDAIAHWEAASEGGRASGAVEYNLGTAWLRKGDAPRAIVRLRAAARLRPRDGSVHHNLALARSMLGPTPPAVGLPSPWMSVVTPGELGLLGVLMAALGSLFVVLHELGRGGPGRLAGGALLALGVVVGMTAWSGSRALAAHPVAVVVGSEAVLRDSASVNAGERFRLPPGAEVRVERVLRGFMLVQDGHERRGWLAEGASERGW